jgi:hypothetical protein
MGITKLSPLYQIIQFALQLRSPDALNVCNQLHSKFTKNIILDRYNLSQKFRNSLNNAF